MYEYVPSTGRCSTPKLPPCKDHYNMQCLCKVSIGSSRPRARLQSEALKTILLALSTTLNTPDPAGKKAMWLPSQKARFLGMHVDAAHQCFILPEEKKQDLRTVYFRALLSPTDSWLRLQARWWQQVQQSTCPPMGQSHIQGHGRGGRLGQVVSSLAALKAYTNATRTS